MLYSDFDKLIRKPMKKFIDTIMKILEETRVRKKMHKMQKSTCI